MEKGTKRMKIRFKRSIEYLEDNYFDNLLDGSAWYVLINVLKFARQNCKTTTKASDPQPLNHAPQGLPVIGGGLHVLHHAY